MKIGLRIDVDTLRGTERGVPALSRMLAERGIQATFFFSVGPDNMGRHLWRLVRPTFLWKMLRSNAPGLYGWDILLRGTFWPGPKIGKLDADVIRQAAADGHEIGLHAWDHHAWQMNVDSWGNKRIHEHLARAYDSLTEILGRPPTCSAAPAWRCNDRILEEKELFPFEYNSDCRGESVFLPVLRVGERTISQPQVPTTLPTYDELVGWDGVTPESYYNRVEELLDEARLNVLTIHAEVEGISLLESFGKFVDRVRYKGWAFVPLGELARNEALAPRCTVERASIPGRQGWVACQAAALEVDRHPSPTEVRWADGVGVLRADGMQP